MKIFRVTKTTKISTFAILLLFVLITTTMMGVHFEVDSSTETKVNWNSRQQAPNDPRIGYRSAEESDDTVVPKIFSHPEIGASIVRSSLSSSVLEANNIELDGVFSEVEEYPSFDFFDIGVVRGLNFEFDPGDPVDYGYAYGIVIA